MTERMVSVPVEPTEAMMKAADAVDWNNEDERASVINMWQAMLSAVQEAGPDGEYGRADIRYGLHLIANEDCDEVAAAYYAKKTLAYLAPLSAAPSAEGGAVHYGDPCVNCGVGHDDVPPGPCRGGGIVISRERAMAVLNYLKKGSGPAGWPTTLWCEVQAFIKNIESALAAREEAPAEAGALVSQIDALLAIPEANLSSRIPYLARELLERSAKHLRAQPQAREEARLMTWNGGVNPVRNYSGKITVTLRNGNVEEGYSDDFQWQHHGTGTDIISYRLATGEEAQPALTVWYGSMPESNGRQNWTATLRRVNPTDKWNQGFCFARSEHPERVRYEADRMRWIIGELAEEPDILAYDDKAHSGYVAPTPPAPDALRVAVEALEAARKVIELFRDEDVLSEGVHTGLRKGTDAKDAHDLWTAIRNSKTSAWSDAIAFALDPYFSMWGGDAAVTKIDQALAALQQEGRDRG